MLQTFKLEGAGHRMRILLVESENNAAAYLRKGLIENGFAVDIARRNSDAMDLACQKNYDLLVCGEMGGASEFTGFSGSAQRTPVLFLAPPVWGDRPSDDGAGSCLRRPFAFSDLLTQVRSILHWGPDGIRETLRIAGLEVDLVRHRAQRDGKRLDLTPKEFLLLSLLMRRTGEVLSRTLIADQVWEINFESNTNFVDVHIRRLRSKVDDPFAKKLIHTVRGAGYLLEDRA